MPAVKSRYSVPSAVYTVHPEPDTTSRSVVRNHTSLRCEPMNSPCGWLARHDHTARVRAAPNGMGETDPCALDLAWAGIAAELVHQLDQLAERRRREWLALRQTPPARVDRSRAAQ